VADTTSSRRTVGRAATVKRFPQTDDELMTGSPCDARTWPREREVHKMGDTRHRGVPRRAEIAGESATSAGSGSGRSGEHEAWFGYTDYTSPVVLRLRRGGAHARPPGTPSREVVDAHAGGAPSRTVTYHSKDARASGW